MKTIHLTFIVLCIVSVLVFGRESARAGEKKIFKKQIPAAVLTAFQTAYPNATIKGQSVETENGKKFYEIESVDGKTKRDLLYTPDGKAVEVEESLDISTLPDVMISTISKEYPKGKIIRGEKVTATSVTYEFQVKVGKKTKEIVLDPSGKLLKGGKKDAEKEEKDEEKEDD